MTSNFVRRVFKKRTFFCHHALLLYLSNRVLNNFQIFFSDIIVPGGGGGDSYMKQTGMLVVSLRGVNFGFWSRLGCPGQSADILSRQGLA